MRKRSLHGAQLLTSRGVLTFDATLSEAHSAPAQVTEHEVETGSAVSDHVRIKPRQITLTGIVTTTPALPFEPGAQRDRQFRDELRQAQEARELVTLICEVGLFDNLVIADISESLSAESGESTTPTVELREVVQVERLTTTLAPLPPTRRDRQRAAPEVDRGEQPGTTVVVPTTVDQARTWLATGLDAVRGMVP